MINDNFLEWNQTLDSLFRVLEKLCITTVCFDYNHTIADACGKITPIVSERFQSFLARYFDEKKDHLYIVSTIGDQYTINTLAKAGIHAVLYDDAIASDCPQVIVCSSTNKLQFIQDNICEDKLKAILFDDSVEHICPSNTEHIQNYRSFDGLDFYGKCSASQKVYGVIVEGREGFFSAKGLSSALRYSRFLIYKENQTAQNLPFDQNKYYEAVGSVDSTVNNVELWRARATLTRDVSPTLYLGALFSLNPDHSPNNLRPIISAQNNDLLTDDVSERTQRLSH